MAEVTLDDRRNYAWDNWQDLLEESERIYIPQKLQFAVEDATGARIHTEKETRQATLDELSAAANYVDRQIEELALFRAGLRALEKRARRIVRPGSTTLLDVLFPKEEYESR